MEPSPKPPEELLDEALDYQSKKDETNFGRYLACAASKIMVMPESKKRTDLIKRYNEIMGGHYFPLPS